MYKKSEEKLNLSETKKKIISFLFKKPGGESFTAEISEGLDINKTTITTELKALEKLKIDSLNLITSEEKPLPKQKVKIRDKAKFYKVNKQLAEKILGESFFILKILP